LALICLAANDLYHGGQQGPLTLPDEIMGDELSGTMEYGLTEPLALQDRDAFSSQGLEAYYWLRLGGCSDDDIIFMLWQDDEPGNSWCESPEYFDDVDDGAVVGGGDTFIRSVYAFGCDEDPLDNNGLDGADWDCDGTIDLHPAIDSENNDAAHPERPSPRQTS
jgi:hypothetical protein